MTRKSLLLGIGLFLLLLGCVGGGLALLLRHEPDFYRRGEVPPGPQRKHDSGEFQTEVAHLYECINFRNQSKWWAKFTEAQINSYFAEDFIKSQTARFFLPRGVSSPRVAIEPDKIRLAFRYGEGTWSTVVSIDLRVWLAKKDPNVVMLELQGLHAGSLPISAQSLLEQISEACQHQHIDVKWYRHNGNPVARLRFPSDSPRPSVQLSKLELRQGMLVIGGRAVPPSLGAPPLGIAAASSALVPCSD
jgi:hypothetical protein